LRESEVQEEPSSRPGGLHGAVIATKRAIID